MRYSFVSAALTTVAASCLLLLAPISAHAQNFFKGTLNGAQEVPANLLTGTGQSTAQITSLATDNNTVVFTLNWSGISGGATGYHVHIRPDATQANGSVVFNFSATAGLNGGIGLTTFTMPTGTFTGVTDAQIQALRNGLWYANVHTAANPGGEIRANLSVAPEPVSVALLGAAALPMAGIAVRRRRGAAKA